MQVPLHLRLLQQLPDTLLYNSGLYAWCSIAGFLDVLPEECLVVEDAVSGAEAGRCGGFPVACVGDASAAGAGDFNLTAFGQLIEVAAQLREGATA